MTAAANGGIGTAKIAIKDFARNLSFATGYELTVDVEGRRLWGGFVMRVERKYYYEGRQRAATPRRLILRGADYNILLRRRVLFDPLSDTGADPAYPDTGVKAYAPDTHDDVIIKHYLQRYVDLAGDNLDVSSLIEYVGTPSTDDDYAGSPGWNLTQFLSDISRNIGSIFYVNPDRQVVYTDVDTPNAPFALVDRPIAPDEVGVRDLEIEFNGDQLCNDALVWGAGQGSNNMVFSRTRRRHLAH